MPSKFDRLRAGEVVEIEPGRKGRLNLENKSFETSDGRTMYVGDDPDFFPRNEQQLGYSREKEGLEREIKNAPFGEFLYQFGNQGVAGAAKDWMNKLIQKGDEYAQTKQIHQEVGKGISERSPWTSGAATAASFIPDIALTKGMSATKAAPLLTAAHAGPRILEEPEQVAGEAAFSAIGGKLIDKGAAALNRIAQRRGQVRALPGEQQAVTESNRLGQEAVTESNRVQNEQFKILKQNVKNVNEARLAQHQADLNVRQNDMIQAQNAYEQAKLARDTEIVRLKNQAEVAKAQRSADAAKLDAEYKAAKASAEAENKRLQDEFKLAKTQYEESVRQLPELQKKAQAEFSEGVVRNAKEIEKLFPKNSKISTDELGIANFVEDSIRKTGLAGTPDSSRASRILRSLFPEGELMGGRELATRYKALEDAIQRSTPEVQQVLNSFKMHLGDRLPVVLEDSVAYSRIMPLLKKTVETDVKSIIADLGLGKEAPRLQKMASANANNFLKNGMLSTNFAQEATSGELARKLANEMLTVEDFLVDVAPESLRKLKKEGLAQYLMQDAQRKHDFFVSEMVKRLETKLGRYEIKAMEAARNASKKLGKEVKNTYGLAEPVTPPNLPEPPSSVAMPSPPTDLPPVSPINLPPPVAAPVTPPMPAKPGLMAEPTAPTPMGFNPQPIPTLPPAQGMSERAGDFLEQNLLSGGKGLTDNPLAKLAGLKYLLGKGALPAEAAYVGMNALTSPTAMGEAARMTFKQGGIQAIDSWARRYPSYRNGILESPQDRRSLTKEIEDASDIPIEQKAVFQSKVNRGRPIQDKL